MAFSAALNAGAAAHVSAAGPGTPPAGAVATHAFVDRADGYRTQVPVGWRFDASRLHDVARWDGPDATLRIFLQPVASPGAVATYVYYSNRSVDQQWNGIRLLDSWQRNGTWFRQWERPAMKLLHPDEREYAEWDTAIAPDRVLTVLVNATPAAFPTAFAAGRQAWSAAQAMRPQGTNGFDLPHPPARAPHLFDPPGTPLQWGVYVPKLSASNLAPVLQLQQRLGYHFRVLMTYLRIGAPFPAALVQAAWSRGQIMELTLQSWEPSANSYAGRAVPYTHGTSLTGAILNGRYDAALRRFAQAAARSGVPFFLRWNNEMNGDWDPWSAFQWGMDTDLYVAAWRHVHDIFARAGASNAVWVWNPNNDNLPPYRWNAAALYYPGDPYVDWVGLTGYNIGNGQPGGVWRTFDQAYRRVYKRDLALYPSKPLLITEFASNDSPGNKAAWINQMFNALPRYPAIRYAVWWNADQNSRLQYSLDKPPTALESFRADLHGGS